MKMFNKKSKINKILFYIIWDGEKRANFLKKHHILYNIGENCLYQSRIFPMDPKLLCIHNNVTIAANVIFCTHDAIRHVYMHMDKANFNPSRGPIEIMDNVFIGAGSIILQNVRVGENSIIAAGSIVTKDVEPGSIVAGNPAKKIGSFNDLLEKRKKLKFSNEDQLWEIFNKNKNKLFGDLK